ncbi:MAG: hypothetical protein RR960_07845 [Alistipes sp.]
MDHLKQLRESRALSVAEVRSLIATDNAFRNLIEELYVDVFHHGLERRCSGCFFDAYIVLMNTKITNLMEIKERKFELQAGKLLIDVVHYDNALMATNVNLTDELALYHLRTNPSVRKFFSKLPDNVDELIAISAVKKAAKVKTPAVKKNKKEARTEKQVSPIDSAPSNPSQE